VAARCGAAQGIRAIGVFHSTLQRGASNRSTMSGYRILIADDHPLFRDALKNALSDGFDALDIDETGSLDGVRDALDADDNFDLILLDLKMPGVQGFSGLMYLRAQYPAVPVVVVSANEDAQVIRTSLDFGASGFIPKSAGADQIRAALSLVMEGEIWVPPDLDLSASQDSESSQLAAKLSTLTPQQVRVLMMLSQGLLNKQIAYELGVSEATVKAHVSAILQKLGVDSRTQAVIVANKIDNGQWSREAGAPGGSTG
jgi:DNA-binding NarL/FixJ family response regulator